MPRISIRRAATVSATAILFGITGVAFSIGQSAVVPCSPDNAGLTLPAGFCATRFAENIGAPRHMVVAPNGDVLVIGNPYNTGAESGGAQEGGSLMVLRDANGDGKAEVVKKLAPGSGSGIALANGYLYSSSGTNILRYQYSSGQLELGAPDTVITELAPGGHSAYNFVITGTTLYLNVGSKTNSCQVTDRGLHAPGINPCVELETRAGVWAFDANRKRQHPADGKRFATGMRNSVALTVDPRDQSLWATMHGRDQLGGGPAAQAAWDFSAEYNAENPGEQTNHILPGDDFGWPYCYYSNEEHKLVTAPEYGGDGKKNDRCLGKKNPEFAFPGHWAPNDMLFYTGSKFPAEYKAGAFVAFHGSWNRAPLPQQGFRVAFLPMRDGKVGPHRDFATDFSAAGGPGRDGKLHRPAGLAQGPDGSLYVADDRGGVIYKISYKVR